MTWRPALQRALGARLAYPVIALAVAGVLVVNEWTHQRTTLLMRGAGVLTNTRLQAMEALQRLTDAETAQRGFLITGRDEYLQPYERARAELLQKLEPTMQFLTQAGGAAGADADAARRLIEGKLAELATTIELQREGKRAEAFAVIESDIGKATMDQIRTTLGRAFDAAAAQRVAVQSAIVNGLEVRRWAIHGLALLGALLLVAYLQRLRGEARQRESSRAQLEQEVQSRTVDLRALAAHLQTTREDERARLSRELHDELGSLLTAAKLDLARAARASDAAQAAERIAQAGKRLDEVVGLKRRIIEDLRPSALEHLGLAKALELLCRDAAQRMECELATHIEAVTLNAQAQITVYRLVQEALTNVQKYARARHVEVALRSRGASLEVTVEDDGDGFDMHGVRVSRHGLAGMRYRVEALGGQLEIDAAPGRGTRLRATLPLAATVPGGDGGEGGEPVASSA